MTDTVTTLYNSRGERLNSYMPHSGFSEKVTLEKFDVLKSKTLIVEPRVIFAFAGMSMKRIQEVIHDILFIWDRDGVADQEIAKVAETLILIRDLCTSKGVGVICTFCDKDRTAFCSNGRSTKRLGAIGDVYFIGSGIEDFMSMADASPIVWQELSSSKVSDVLSGIRELIGGLENSTFFRRNEFRFKNDWGAPIETYVFDGQKLAWEVLPTARLNMRIIAQYERSKSFEGRLGSGPIN